MVSRLTSFVLVVLTAAGCRCEQSTVADSSPAPAPSASQAAPPAVPELEQAILSAEQRRDARAIPAEALTHRRVELRRLATRALSRIADAATIEPLTARLADEDPEVSSWAAYGLGYACAERPDAIVERVVARAASLDRRHQLGSRSTTDKLSLMPSAAFAGALARCGTSAAEETLRDWLARTEPVGRAAAVALSRLAATRRLDDRTIVALLDAATRSPPVPEALQPFRFASSLSNAQKDRLREAAGPALHEGGLRSAAGIRALANAGAEAAPMLGAALEDEERAAVDRSAAASALAELGSAGQVALVRALATLAPPDRDVASLLEDRWAPIAATLAALSPPVGALSSLLDRLATLELPDESSAAARRRAIGLRCRAAGLLAGTASLSARLRACDPDDGPIGARAVLEVLDRGGIVGARSRRYREFLSHDSPAVRRQALELLATHFEIDGTAGALAAALSDDAPGVVATAGRLIARHPSLASSAKTDRGGASADEPGRRAPPPDPAVTAALKSALDAERPADQIEVRVDLVQAAAALQLLSSKAAIENDCTSENPTLRAHAERALRKLGDPRKRCQPAERQAPAPLPSLVRQPVVLTFVTDAGRTSLTLDPDLAPVTVARLVELARAGFYDGIAIHQGVPGDIVQFGDPGGDGYGGAGRPPLRSETSPVPFEALRVGLALGGRDTGSSQLFVTLADSPQLTGDYPILGWADPEWALLARGDRIREVVVQD